MGVVTNTLQTAETLREAGVPVRQAAAHADAMEKACATAVEGLVTREHLQVETAALRGELADLERRLILWAVGVGITVGVASVSILVQLLG